LSLKQRCLDNQLYQKFSFASKSQEIAGVVTLCMHRLKNWVSIGFFVEFRIFGNLESWCMRKKHEDETSVRHARYQDHTHSSNLP